MDFQKVKNAVEPEVSVNDVSRISIGTIIKGEISSDCDIRVDGKVEGKIFSKGKVVVGPQAVINGGLACQTLDFWGKMKGDIYVKDLLTLKAKAESSSVRSNHCVPAVNAGFSVSVMR